jgi:hypothetical protein
VTAIGGENESNDGELGIDTVSLTVVYWGHRQRQSSQAADESGATIMSANVINSGGKILDFETAIVLMDDELCEELHIELAPCTEQEFFTAYEARHEQKFGEEWELSKQNPIW